MFKASRLYSDMNQYEDAFFSVNWQNSVSNFLWRSFHVFSLRNFCTFERI